MAAVTPIRSLVDKYSTMSDVDVGRTASGGYGVDKQKVFVSDLRELCRLARIGERAHGGRA